MDHEINDFILDFQLLLPDHSYEYRLGKAIEELVKMLEVHHVIPCCCVCGSVPFLKFRQGKPRELAWLLTCLQCSRFLRAPDLFSLFDNWKAGKGEMLNP